MHSIKIKPKANPTETEQRQMEAAKTNRLRALRLAKEAADREAAAAEPPKTARRSRSAARIS